MNKDYECFLSSNQWKLFTEQRKKTHNKCAICGSTHNLITHHTKYTDNLFDNNFLITLCDACHDCLHNCLNEVKDLYKKEHILMYHPVTKILTDATLNFYIKSFKNNTTGFNVLSHDCFLRYKDILLASISNQINHKVFISEYTQISLNEISFEASSKEIISKYKFKVFKEALEYGISEYEIKKQLQISNQMFYKFLDKIKSGGSYG